MECNENNQLSAIARCSICLNDLPKEWPEKFSITCYKSENGQKIKHSFCSTCLYNSIDQGCGSCAMCRKQFKNSMAWKVTMADLLSKKPEEDRYCKATVQKIINAGKVAFNKNEELFNQELEFVKAQKNSLLLTAQKLLDDKQKLNNDREILIKTCKHLNYFLKLEEKENKEKRICIYLNSFLFGSVVTGMLVLSQLYID